jgi:[ribosomal protein S5]-alanine N-acetyltransferase
MASVVLRHPTAADEAAFLAAMRASRSLHRPWLYPPQTPAAYAAYLERLGDTKVGYLACRAKDGAIVGWLNVSEIVRGSLNGAYLGYGGVAGYAGQGYMTEALRLVLREVFVTLKLHRLEANIQPGNRSSIALVQRCGFEREGFSPRYLKVGGRWRDHERWAIIAERWRADGRGRR